MILTKTYMGFEIFTHGMKDYISNIINCYGCWEPNITKYIIELFKKDTESNKIIFDVGSNIGYYSILFSFLDNNSKIHSFEPLKINYEIIEKTIKHNNIKNITLNKYCIGDKDNEKLYLSFEGNNIDVNSNIGGTHIVKKSSTETYGMTLDTYIEDNNINQIFLMKVDIEGYEPNLIKGAMKSLKNRIFKYIIIEITPKFCDFNVCKDIINTIITNEYICYDLGLMEGGHIDMVILKMPIINNDNIDKFIKSIIQSNLLFVRK
ncbi:methyltransferase FkbM [Fadolivirus algeromassiliense]|jgi:FkbM family methyltransferase|uniref:Methyltransferase FkbM n=1 Tax=Fadolivirus FV1/VV64 TaxID=3070911 RepID=A0A7D3UW84_9VIRU|nr:methyltransferase FkbM [Fadolivirus algeromassiliense]QKF94634.1 methyltransferase FkbM [Fadolivirus FV1/VV64]